MYQSVVLQPPSSHLCLSLNIENVDGLFPGFVFGDFGVFHGFSVHSLLTRVCVRAQFPFQLGGLESKVLFVDGSNTFKLYDVSSFAQRCGVDPWKVLENVFVSRAFTAYQLTSVVFEQMQDAIEDYGVRVVILSDLVRLFLDKDVPKREAQEVFLQLTSYLAKFAENKRVVLVASHPSGFWSRRSRFFEETLCSRAKVVASVRNFRSKRCFILEKHPVFSLGKTEFPCNEVTLADFLEN